MMTEAVVTPWLSDRDLALQNVRYVMNAAAGLAEDFQPAPGGLIATRADQVLDEAVDLLGRIVDDGLLPAIADGTFGLMKRPADRGKGLDGVMQRAEGYLNPVVARSSRRCRHDAEQQSSIRPYGDATGDGMVQVSFTLPIPHDKRAEGAAAQLARKMGIDPALVVHAKPMGPDFTFFVVYGRVNHLVELDKVEVVERDFPLLTPKEVNARIKKRLRRPLVVVGACIGSDAHTVGIDAILNIKGFAGEKGLEYYSSLEVHNLGAQVSVPELVAAAGTVKADAVLVSQVVTQRDAHLHNTREMTAAFREAFPRRAPAGDRRRRSALRRVDGRRARGRPDLRQGHDAGRGGLVPGAPTGQGGMSMSIAGGGAGGPGGGVAGWCTGATCPTPTPTTRATSSMAPTSLALFGDVATELMIHTDGDEGLFASYSDVQFRSALRGGDVVEVTATLVRAGRRSREIEFAAHVVCRGTPERGANAAEVLAEPLLITTARGTVVAPA